LIRRISQGPSWYFDTYSNAVMTKRGKAMRKSLLWKTAVLVAVCLLTHGATMVQAENGDDDWDQSCKLLPSHDALKVALDAAQAATNGGFGLNMWGTVVNRDGIVCAVAFTGTARGDQWPGSRVIAASKASTANGLSGANYALSTANVFAASQPGQSLYSLATSASPNVQAVFGDPASFGTPNDPMVGKAIGGVIVFGGGLPLYSPEGMIVGGLGLSGDTSCTDHIIAWKVRSQLHLDSVPMGPSADHNDNMILDFKNGVSVSGFGHPSCKGGNTSDYITNNLSKQYPTGPRKK